MNSDQRLILFHNVYDIRILYLLFLLHYKIKYTLLILI